jgi:integrase
MDGKPFGEKFFRDAFAMELEAIGISQAERKRRNLTLHGLRHSFITLGRAAGISDLEIMALSGHHSLAMSYHYTHAGQALNIGKARRELEKMQGAA